VTAIVAQRRESIRRYIEETGLPFDVLVDERRDVIRAYGVWHRMGIVTWNRARPAAFLIDPDATIRASWIGANQTEFPSAVDILARM
jgi:peroxiredoxin